MQQLQSASHGISSAASCASEILDAVPAVLQFIRAQIWRHSGPDLSVPQFRTLAFLNRTPGTSLSALAEFLGLSLDRKSTRLNSSHLGISYAVFCLKKK